MEKNYSDIGNESLNAFFNLQIDYYMPHIFFKYAVDYLDPITLKKLLPKFEDVRKYAEHVFDETEEFTLKIATQIASNLGYTAEQILNCTKAEIISYFKNKILPAKEILKSRSAGCNLLFDRNDFEIITGESVASIEKNYN